MRDIIICTSHGILAVDISSFIEWRGPSTVGIIKLLRYTTLCKGHLLRTVLCVRSKLENFVYPSIHAGLALQAALQMNEKRPSNATGKRKNEQ